MSIEDGASPGGMSVPPINHPIEDEAHGVEFVNQLEEKPEDAGNEEAFVEAVNKLPEGVPGISEFETRLAKKKADEDAEEARKISDEKSNPLRPLTEEEFSDLSWEDRAVRAEALLGNQAKAMNAFLLKLGKAFQHAITDLEYKQQDGHKHAVFSKEIVRDLFKRAFGKTMEDAANVPAEAK